MISCETSAIAEAEAKFRYNPKTNDSTWDPDCTYKYAFGHNSFPIALNFKHNINNSDAKKKKKQSRDRCPVQLPSSVSIIANQLATYVRESFSTLVPNAPRA